MKKIISVILCCMLAMSAFAVSADSTQLQNVALNTAASVSASQSWVKIPSAVIDGINQFGDNSSSYYAASEVTYTINLGGLYNVSNINMHFGGDGIPAEFTLSYSSDDENYTNQTYTDNTNSDLIKEFNAPQIMQYVKLTIAASTEPRVIRINEVEIMGEFAQPGRFNLAEGKTVTASLEEALSIGITDGNNFSADKPSETSKGAWSYWGAGQQYAIIDLGALYSISQIKGYFGYPYSGEQRPDTGFAFSYSADGKSYTDIVKIGDKSYDIDYTYTLDEVVNARYVKLTIPKADAARAVRVREVEVYGINKPIINVTQSRAVTISATVGSNNVSGITDGNTIVASGTNAWSNSSLGSATIDLGAICSINQINGYFGYPDGAMKPKSFTIELSKTGNDDWTEFAKEDEDVLAYSYNYVKKAADGTEARYVRLTVNSLLDVANAHFRVREIEVYGSVNGVYFSKTENEDTSAEYTIYNNTNNFENVAVIKATYSENALDNVSLEEIKYFAPQTSCKVSAQAGERVFIWDGISTMKPIYER